MSDFHRLAGVYDRAGPRYFSQFGEHLAAFASVRPSARVLDVACGAGAVAFAAARRAGGDGEVIGVDASDAMVRRATSEATLAGVTTCQFRTMCAEELRFSSDTFDVVLCGFALFLLADLPRGLSEMGRVTRPGGTVAASILGPERDRRWWWLIGSLRRIGSVARPPSDPSGLHAAFSDAGLEPCVLEEDRLDVAYSSEEEWRAVFAAQGAGRLLERLSPSARAAFDCSAHRHLALALENDGAIHHRMTATFARAVKQ